jgi:hypothetical protein
MALFPELIIRSKSKNKVVKLWPLQVDKQTWLVPQSGQCGLSPADISKAYAFIDISNVEQVPREKTKALFDLFFDAQDHVNILDIEIAYFQDNKREKNGMCRYRFRGWITQYVIIDPVTDLRRYVDSDWKPSREYLQSNLPSIGGDSYMALLRLELTAATDKDNSDRDTLQGMV